MKKIDSKTLSKLKSSKKSLAKGGLVGEEKTFPKSNLNNASELVNNYTVSTTEMTLPEYEKIAKRYGRYIPTSAKETGSDMEVKGFNLEAVTKDGIRHIYSPKEAKQYFPKIDFDKLRSLKDGGMVKGKKSFFTGGEIAMGKNVIQQVGKEIGSSVGSAIMKNVDPEIDWRNDPYTDKNRRKMLAAKMASETDFTTPWGIAKGIFDHRKNLDNLKRESIEWKQGMTEHAVGMRNLTGYKEGGKIKGKGTGKSDDIAMRAEEGSFVVPAENKDRALEIGKEYLGWDDDTLAKRNYGEGTDVNVSNGEVLFTKNEASLLDYYGIDYKSLAPKADENKKGMADGGEIMKEYEEKRYDPRLKATPDALSKTNIFLPSSKEDMLSKLKESGKGKKIAKSIVDHIPELAGSLQALGGLHGLIREGAAPTMKVSDTLRKLSAEVRQMANYGYEPKVVNALNRNIDNAYKDMTNTIVGKGGSPMEVMAKLKETLSTTLDKKADIIYADAAEKARKYTDVLRVDTAKAGQEFEASKINIDDYYKKQEAFGSLLSSGISNVIGARAYKDNLDAIKKAGNTKLEIKL